MTMDQEKREAEAHEKLRVELSALTTERPGLNGADWENTCNKLGWNEESQIVHLEGFISMLGLMPAFAAYAARAAEEEEAECGGDPT